MASSIAGDDDDDDDDDADSCGDKKSGGAERIGERRSTF